jgi:hypothetical protein
MGSPIFQLSLSWQTLAAGIVALILALKILQSLVASPRNAKLPPGPKGQWLLGVTKDMLDTSVKPWTRFDAWSKEYNAREYTFRPIRVS